MPRNTVNGSEEEDSRRVEHEKRVLEGLEPEDEDQDDPQVGVAIPETPSMTEAEIESRRQEHLRKVEEGR